MTNPILGVIGGMGPMATARFLELTTQMTDTAREQGHLDMVIYNFPSIPDRTAYLLGRSRESPLPRLIWAAQNLEHQGAGVLAIPCVTAHCFYSDIQASVSVPILNAVEETVNQLKRSGISAAGIMATQGTISSALFSSALERAGIRPILPTPCAQADIDHLIYDDIKQGRPPDMERFYGAEAALRQAGAEAIILGCTELSLIHREHLLSPCFIDAMEALARAAVLACGKSLKTQYRCPCKGGN